VDSHSAGCPAGLHEGAVMDRREAPESSDGARPDVDERAQWGHWECGSGQNG